MLSLNSITKHYNGFTALDGVNLEIKPGRIHGLVGLNGSGKTTLMGIVSGQAVIHKTGGFSGVFEFDGKPRCFTRPSQAAAAGIGMVHQEFALIPGMDGTDNISLSRECVKPWTRLFGKDLALIDRRGNRALARKILDGLCPDLSPDHVCHRLPVAMKQFVEVARELNRSPLKLLLLDEPTAVLGPGDADRLMDAVRQTAQRGVAVLYVSHRLEEVAACCHEVTVLRNGRVAGSLSHNPENLKERSAFVSRLSGLVTGKGRSFGGGCAPGRTSDRIPLLEVKNLEVDKAGDRLTHLDLTIFKGEILGITSLSGHGRTALAPGLFGLCPSRGQILFKQRPLARLSPEQMIANRIWMLPEDRREQGILADHSILENMTFAPVQSGRNFIKTGPLPFLKTCDHTGCRAYARQSVKDLSIQCRSIYQKAGELSGGNQQKVCMAHAMAMAPDLLFVGDPTRGIDIAAKESVLTLLSRAREEKGTTLVISSGEVAELKRICDRIAVFYNGKLFEILDPKQDEADFNRACAGQRTIL